eukprot:907834-Rhodomonas_salina.1
MPVPSRSRSPALSRFLSRSLARSLSLSHTHMHHAKENYVPLLVGVPDTDTLGANAARYLGQ